jgi:hypothetical protein
MKLTIRNYHPIKLHLTGLFLLVVMLCSAVSHSHDVPTENSQAIEQLDCKLCQQQLDPPKQHIKLAGVTLGCFSADKELLVDDFPLIPQYRSCSPRAPPISI